jgi:hypothetical protein
VKLGDYLKPALTLFKTIICKGLGTTACVHQNLYIVGEISPPTEDAENCGFYLVDLGWENDLKYKKCKYLKDFLMKFI